MWILFLILGWKSGTHGHHQTLCFLAQDVLSGNLGWDQVAGLTTEEYPISLLWDTLVLLLQYTVGQYPFAQQSAVFSI